MSLRNGDGYRSDFLFRVLAVTIVTAAPLRAYTDPGSGMLIWQVAGAFFVGCVYQVRKFLLRIRKRK